LKGISFHYLSQIQAAVIPPDDLPKIFNPFFTRKANGTGLGLPITQRIIYQHQGNIDVQSVVGEGTQFNIKIPIIRQMTITA